MRDIFSFWGRLFSSQEPLSRLDPIPEGLSDEEYRRRLEKRLSSPQFASQTQNIDSTDIVGMNAQANTETGKVTLSTSKGESLVKDEAQLVAEVNHQLIKEGLMSLSTPPITARLPYPDFKPLKVSGKPASEIIIEERR